MSRISKSLLGVFVSLIVASVVQAQQSSVSSQTSLSNSFPRLVRFSGTLPDRRGASPTAAAVARVTFAIYEEQSAGAVLWSEIQDIRLDAQGRYSILLGAASSDGLPAELFLTAGARWLGVEVEGRQEEARILLVAVPYALKAADADTLGGKPATAYVLSAGEESAPANATLITATPTRSATRGSNLTSPGATPQEATSSGPTDFVGFTADQLVSILQSGSGVGLRASVPSNSALLGEISGTAGSGVYGRATATSGATNAVQGDVASSAGVGVLGRSFATAGIAKGVYGRSFSTGGIGVHGDATTTTGATRGVWGSSASTGGIGVYGQAWATSGTTYGVTGTVASTAGIAVLAQANAASGTTTGLLAKVLSTTGVALVADNAVGGKVLSARNNGVEKFSVGGDGNVKLASGGKITFPDSSVQSRASNVSGPETLRILRGTVNTSGSILAGSGFTVTRNGAGDFTITYSTAFSGQPSVVATAAVVSPAAITAIILSSALTTSARIGLVNAAGTAQDAAFEFIAIGPP